MLFAAWVLSALAMGFGALLGARGLMDPRWAAKLVRLREDEQGGGFAEFRATYGGVFLGLHIAALYLVVSYLRTGAPLAGVAASGAAFVLAIGWAGAAFGRVFAILRDPGCNTPFNRLSAGVETAMAVLIGLPWALWLLAGEP
ncbi:MAG: hypothetical protein K2P58_11355 [Hyphomonadaceae bacterium]|nr:hypothetical protein [Hyphomonadaceae bacterium]